MKNKKKIALGAGVLAAALIIGGTFAWFSTTDSMKNQFGLENFDVAISEDFDPNVPVVPGADITKQVQIENGGNVDVVVRVKLEESLHLLEQDQQTDKNVDKIKLEWAADPAEISRNKIPAKVSEDMYKAKKAEYKTQITAGAPEGVEIWQKTTQSGTNTVYSYFAVKNVSGEHQLVKVTPIGWTDNNSKANPNKFDVLYGYHTWKGEAVTATHGKNDEVLNAYLGSTFHDSVILNFGDRVQFDKAALKANTVWYLANDGYFYYCKPLNGGKISEPLLKSVKFADNAANGMRGAEYTLTPVMEAIQKDHEAVRGTWADLTGYASKNAVGAVNKDQEQLVYNVIQQNQAYFAAP